MMKQTRYYTVVLAALLPVLVLSASQSGCGKKDDEEVKPIASAPPPPPPAPTAPAVVTPEEDAGPDAAPDADASDGRVVTGTGTGVASQSIAKCCAALQQNANSAPLEQKGAYQAAASACLGLKSTPVAQQAFAQLRSFLAGAKMPGACQ